MGSNHVVRRAAIQQHLRLGLSALVALRCRVAVSTGFSAPRLEFHALDIFLHVLGHLGHYPAGSPARVSLQPPSSLTASEPSLVQPTLPDEVPRGRIGGVLHPTTRGSHHELTFEGPGRQPRACSNHPGREQRLRQTAACRENRQRAADPSLQELLTSRAVSGCPMRTAARPREKVESSSRSPRFRPVRGAGSQRERGLSCLLGQGGAEMQGGAPKKKVSASVSAPKPENAWYCQRAGFVATRQSGSGSGNRNARHGFLLRDQQRSLLGWNG